MTLNQYEITSSVFPHIREYKNEIKYCHNMIKQYTSDLEKLKQFENDMNDLNFDHEFYILTNLIKIKRKLILYFQDQINTVTI